MQYPGGAKSRQASAKGDGHRPEGLEPPARTLSCRRRGERHAATTRVDDGSATSGPTERTLVFTGIIQACGTVTAHETVAGGGVLRVEAASWSHRPAPGESIAVDGCCLTATEDEPGALSHGHLRFDVVPETLRKTVLAARRSGDRVNLEHAVTPSTLLGGHIVQGHVDGIGTVTAVEASDSEWLVTVRAPGGLADAIVPTGSIAVNGVSLTVAAVEGECFRVALIPTTVDATNLGRLRAGDAVNLESDYLAKTIVHYLRRRGSAPAAGPRGRTGT